MTSIEFCQILKAQGYDFACGVPCSILGDIIDCLSNSSELTYVPATREDEAIGIATGAYLGGKKPLVLMQNSGFGNCINALTSLVLLYKIPLLFLIGWRGENKDDAPEHLIMGEAMLKLLDSIGLEYQVIGKGQFSIEEKKPFALILRQGILG